MHLPQWCFPHLYHSWGSQACSLSLSDPSCWAPCASSCNINSGDLSLAILMQNFKTRAIRKMQRKAPWEGTWKLFAWSSITSYSLSLLHMSKWWSRKGANHKVWSQYSMPTPLQTSCNWACRTKMCSERSAALYEHIKRLYIESCSSRAPSKSELIRGKNRQALKGSL